MNLIPYEELDKHFTTPKNFGKEVHFKGSKVPRKFKKKWRHILQGDRYDFLNLGQKLWYILEFTNPNYKRFLIKKLCERYGADYKADSTRGE